MSDLPFDLALPDDLTIDAVAVDRLARQLATAPETVTGIIAAVDDLPPGASTRTHAEWRSLVPLDRTIDVDAEAPDGVPEGPVLRRRGAASGDGLLRIDSGAVAHRRSIPSAPDEAAGAESRSPFPWRPTVLFLAIGDAGDDAPADQDEVLGRLLEGLLDADVEARLATPATGTAVRRHRPCAPTAATVERLAPDVLVALDAAALDQGPGWCNRRGTVVVDMTGAGGEGVELVPWRIGTHPGRLRARVARSVGPADLARLVNRLAAGPQPVPPRPTPSRPAPSRPTPSRPAPSRPDTGDTGVGVAIGSAAGRRIAVVGPTGLRLLDSLTDRAAAAGHLIDRDPAHAAGADVAFVAAQALPDAAGLISERAAAGRPTVAVIEHEGRVDVVDPGALADGLVAVSVDVEAIDRMHRAGVPALCVPIMTTTGRYQALRAAAELPVTPSADVIGWTILRTGDRAGPDDAPVAAALVDLIGDHPDLTVEVVADQAGVPEALRDRTEVALVRGLPDPGELARHRVHLLTAPTGASVAAMLTVMLPSAHVGVPTLVSAETARTVGGLADPRLVVPPTSEGGPTSAQAWADLLRRLLDGPDARSDRAGRSARARACAEALDGPGATDLVISRLLGWLDRLGRS